MSIVAVTGASGYIGTALTALLAERWTVRPVERARLASLRRSDWSDVDAVVHLSAQTNLRFAEANPADDERANVDSMRAVLAAARPGTRVVFASTATIAGIASHVDPTTPDAPITVYDRHKLAAEQLLARATERGDVRGVSLRLANVFGFGVASRNSARSVLNLMIRRAFTGEPLTIFGEGQYLRDFIHLSDVVTAFLAALACPATGPFPIGTGTGTSLAGCFAIVAEEAERITGRKVPVTHVAEPPDLHAIERRSAVVDPAAFVAASGWHPRTSLREGIRRDLTTIAAAASQAGVPGTVATAPISGAGSKGAITP